MASRHEVLLSTVPGWIPKYVQKLGKSWITTAEQVVAIAETPHGITNLAEQLGVKEPEVDQLLEKARAALPDEVVHRLRERVDTSEFGLGAQLHRKK